MTDLRKHATELLKEFKGDRFAFGLDCIDRTGPYAAELGRRALVFANPSTWMQSWRDGTIESLKAAGVDVLDVVGGSRPNSPYEDVFRMQADIETHRPDVLVMVGAGSGIDALKAANVLATFTPGQHDLEPFFGVGKVAAAANETGRDIVPMVAVEMASSSAAHLTKYSNVTDFATNQKKLIIDEAIVPPRAVFDYRATVSMSPEFTRDGGNDGISHNLEVYMGAKPESIDTLEDITLTGIELIVGNLERAVENGDDLEARTALGLGTDLGGYAIMVGGTNGAHLNSFSMVDVLPHGRACAVLNPYYVVFFSPAIERQLRGVGRIYREAGYIEEDIDSLAGRELGEAVARGMQALNRAIGFPTTLGEIEGFSDDHIRRALDAARNPQLESKLKQMPVPLTADGVDRYMGSVLEAARTGDFSTIVTMD